MDFFDFISVLEFDNFVFDGVVVLVIVVVGSKEGGNDGVEGGDEFSEEEGVNRFYVG